LKIFSATRLIIMFAVSFSFVSLTGPMSAGFHLPSIQPIHAIAQTCQTIGSSGACSEYWVPAGPAMDTEQATIFTDESAEFTNIQSATPSIDLTDWPLTPDLTGPFTVSPNFRITATTSQAGYFEIQFMLANNFWGINMNFGNNPNGTQIRQGISHLIDKAIFAANEPSIAGTANALDTAEPSDNVGGLPAANPCAWDSTFTETGTNCVVGSPGGTAYHLATSTGANSITWLPAPGSADLNAAAQHFVNAGVASGFNPATSVLTGISSTASTHAPSFFIRNDNPPRLDLGNSLSEEICYLFTGAYTVPCAYLSVVSGPITAFPGFTTSNTSINLSWGMYTAAYASTTGPSPFDSTYYFTYNSRFASGIRSIQPPNGPCASAAIPTVSAPDYMYLCNATFDSLTNQMEFAPCLSVAGDPVVGSTSNISTGHCPGTTSALSAIGAGVQAEDQFGKNAYTIPIFEQNAQFGYLNNGWTRVINNSGAGLPNYFTWLNAWNPTPGLPGTIRQGFKQSTTSVNPYIASTVWDFYVISNIYDTLAMPNPLSGGQLLDWMSLNIQQLPNSVLTYTPPAGTVASFRFTLRGDLFWQDGRRVSPWDVKFSYLSLLSTGAFQGGPLAPVTGVTILGTSQFDVNINAVGPFTELSLTSVTVLPGRYWSTCSGSLWDGYVGVNHVPDNCMVPDPSKTTASYDPLGNGILIGSGPWTCTSSIGKVGSGCSSSGTMNPPVGGSYVLSRFGKGLPPASSISGVYFRSNGNLAAYLWSQDTGDITHDFLNFSVVASCFGAAVTSTGPCAHFQRGIGANGGPISVGLSQVAIVNRFVGLNWVAPFNWIGSPPVGIIPLAPVLYENTLTLNPSSVAGCTAAYPTGGYDC